jgi:hypothetical protein
LESGSKSKCWHPLLTSRLSAKIIQQPKLNPRKQGLITYQEFQTTNNFFVQMSNAIQHEITQKHELAFY